MKNTEIVDLLRRLANELESDNADLITSSGYAEAGPFTVIKSIRFELNPYTHDCSAVQVEWRERVRRTDEEVEAHMIRSAATKQA